MLPKSLLLFLCLLGLITPARAQGFTHPSFRSLHLEETIPGAAVHALIEDRQGRLWAGTSAGLAQFTGVAAAPRPSFPMASVRSAPRI